MTFLIALTFVIFGSFGTPSHQPGDHKQPGIHAPGVKIIIKDELGG